MAPAGDPLIRLDGNQKSGINSPVEVGSLSHDLQGFNFILLVQTIYTCFSPASMASYGEIQTLFFRQLIWVCVMRSS